MNLNEYQLKASDTVCQNIKRNEAYFALGLTGEAGEVAEKIKKSLRDGTLNVVELQKELGDVLWYVSQLALVFNLDLEGIALMNLNKLKDRQNRGKIKGNGDNR